MYSYTTAGSFGLEDMVRTSGPGMALIYQLVIPFFWCIPISLVAAELTTAMPVEGGFYRWTRAAFGDFWGFLAGWWNWCASFMLGALYAVLFTDYLSFYFPALTGWKHFAVAVLVIAVISYINVRGIRLVGRVVTVMELAILAVVLVMCLMSVRMWHHNPFSPAIPPHTPLFPVFGVGFALGLWLYAGYEQVSSVAEEVEDPQRSYPRALAWVVPLSMATYLLPTACALAALGEHDRALVEYGRGIDAATGKIRAIAFYDRGTSLFRLGRILDARAAYVEALRLDPNDRDAKFNVEVIDRILGQLPPQKTAPTSSPGPATQAPGQQQPGGSPQATAPATGSGNPTGTPIPDASASSGAPEPESVQSALTNFRRDLTVDEALRLLDALRGEQRASRQ